MKAAAVPDILASLPNLAPFPPSRRFLPPSSAPWDPLLPGGALPLSALLHRTNPAPGCRWSPLLSSTCRDSFKPRDDSSRRLTTRSPPPAPAASRYPPALSRARRTPLTTSLTPFAPPPVLPESWRRPLHLECRITLPFPAPLPPLYAAVPLLPQPIAAWEPLTSHLRPTPIKGPLYDPLCIVSYLPDAPVPLGTVLRAPALSRPLHIAACLPQGRWCFYLPDAGVPASALSYFVLHSRPFALRALHPLLPIAAQDVLCDTIGVMSSWFYPLHAALPGGPHPAIPSICPPGDCLPARRLLPLFVTRW
ncbi:hypothetical protein B0H14DRAFT_3860322 [Mycena olivaceomarginata]|nr:hypothetical protein B0H14DRAFT_3860322 [Mycena olivaceomarginata]